MELVPEREDGVAVPWAVRVVGPPVPWFLKAVAGPHNDPVVKAPPLFAADHRPQLLDFVPLLSVLPEWPWLERNVLGAVAVARSVQSPLEQVVPPDRQPFAYPLRPLLVEGRADGQWLLSRAHPRCHADQQRFVSVLLAVGLAEQHRPRDDRPHPAVPSPVHMWRVVPQF